MTFERRIDHATGREPCDFVIKSTRVLDVVTGEFIHGDVAISDGVIVGIGDEYFGQKESDGSGVTLVPGFIDTHLHVESSLVTPYEFDRCVTPRGVTTAICDPHEISNVIGTKGLEYFLDVAPHLLMDLKVQISSCVPSTNMETSGAVLTASDLQPYLDHPHSLGLAELMNFPGVIHKDAGVLDKLRLFQGRHIDGHAPLLSGKDLNAYVSVGIRTEHEATHIDEAREKLQKGLRVLIREGSVSKDLDALLPLLGPRTSAYMCLCTDDRNPLDIAEQGHLDYMIRHAISQGVDPVDIYRAASLSAAEAFGMKDRGQIAPGKRADIVALNDLETCDVAFVVAAGRLVTPQAFEARPYIEPVGRASVHLPSLSQNSFRTSSNEPKTPVIGIIEGKIITEHLSADIPSTNGDKSPDPSRDLARITVIERHGKNGNIANGFVSGFTLETGAIASSVCHDHHNVAVVGVDYPDMLRAAERVAEIEGGFVVVQNGEILAELALPIAGLMSDRPFEEVHEALIHLREAAKSLGVTLAEPFLQLAFVALPVIPRLKITDHGVIDVDKFEIISPATHR